MANYPTSLDLFTNPSSVDSLSAPSHSLQHADANDAIEALEAKLGIGNSPAGSATAGRVLVAGTGGTTTWTTVSAGAISTTGGTAGQYLSAGTAGVAQWADVTPSALVLVKTQVIGTAVSSVQVTSAFSSTYDSYKIIVSDGVASANGGNFRMTLGATASGYYSTGFGTQFSNVFNAFGTTTGTYWDEVGTTQTTGLSASIDLFNPFLSKPTYMQTTYTQTNYAHYVMGFLNNTTSYTDFTLTLSGATLTGGTIRVYGYRNS